jgi:hypothetical protein
VRQHNQWTLGEREFGMTLPPEQRGFVGCRLVPMTINPAIGAEVCLLFTEDPKFVGGYAEVSPINLLAHNGLVATPHGPVAFIVWQVAAGSSVECFMEQFLNPASSRACDLVAQAGCQTNLKMIIVDNQSSEVSIFVDFENCFALDELAEIMSEIESPNDETSFPAAVEYATVNHDIMALISRAG